MSEAVVFNGVVHVSGQVPTDPSQDIQGQTRQVLAAIDAILTKADTDKSKLLTAQIFLTDMADFKAMNTEWEAWVSPGNAPTRATVQAQLAHPSLKVEILVTAAL